MAIWFESNSRQFTHSIVHDDADIDAGESEAARKEESKWTDLDLEAFRPSE